ncbi:hypothetical protein STEG23_017234, partial [Scotinomys teguina]
MLPSRRFLGASPASAIWALHRQTLRGSLELVTSAPRCQPCRCCDWRQASGESADENGIVHAVIPALGKLRQENR